TAHRYGVGTLIVKSGDGTSYWPQFSSSLVSALHAGGLGVCAWQYVYGNQPGREARVGARAVRAGADCLLIDAESDYEGKYVQAQRYLRKLRARVGAHFRIGLASFPYVDFHPSFPYSVFLGPGGAQFNVPQMYWRDIGVSPGAVYSHTFSFNTPYGRPILPLGQAYNSPPSRQIKRFRQLRWVYHAYGLSWWDWQSATPQAWHALRAPIQRLVASPQTQMPTLSQNGQGGISAGDLVVWAQEHLISAGYAVTVDGTFGPKTTKAVLQFQTAQNLPLTGQVDPTTWAALLRYPPAHVTWTAGGATVARAGVRALPPPASARLPALAYEIPAHLGAGRPGPVSR
ncbi:MAG TPA: peptidoglycan-binding domain-containing protein, partial [Solirubrobacteraceae bacterium]|nr:peptidoglycan-binding domain-containing protein [Solirubrobacteraceae bacterium]